MNSQGLDAAIRSGLSYLASHQNQNGSFDGWSSAQPDFAQARAYRTTFDAAIILEALRFLGAHPVRDKLAGFLLGQKSRHWTFNYWPKHSAARRSVPYPDDLDDTFAALSALYHYHQDLIDGSVLAHVVKVLLATEIQPGGPYRTWLVPPAAKAVWRDVDVAVNANIAYFLRLAVQPLPSLNAYLEEQIKAGAYQSPYYPSVYPTWYYVSRAYQGPLTNRLRSDILAARDRVGHWRTPLQTALAISAMARLQNQLGMASAINLLLTTQASDGSWPAEAFCLDPTIDNQTYYHGSACLTTAFVLEALSTVRQPILVKPEANRPDIRAEAILNQIKAAANQAAAGLGLELRRQVKSQIRRQWQADTDHEITLLPYLFSRSLGRQAKPLAPLLFRHLGLANLYGWLAYTIYDDFLDDEGRPVQLGAANWALRSSVLHFQAALPRHAAFQKYVLATFTTIDDANTWEVAHCRFTVSKDHLVIGPLPTFGNRQRLAERSLGHTLTPLAVLTTLGYPPGSPVFEAASTALRHYVIARQLSDDAHDWMDDLKRGHITYVVARLLKDAQLPTGTHAWPKILPRLERQFWHQTLPAIYRDIQRHLRQAKRALGSPVIKDSMLNALVDRIANKAESTLASQQQAVAFYKTYKKKGA